MAAPEKVNILMVDDQPARLLTYQTVLAELGQNLVCARSGAEALEKLMRDEFAVVLLDVSMPDMDGFEAARLIHNHPRFEKTPIIFVTGVHVTELDRLKGYKVGAVDYVSIPVVPEILRSKVAVLVELYCKRRELQELNRNLARANEQLAAANVTLQAEKNRELQILNTTLQHANAELERANHTLQNEVADRLRAERALKEADRHKDEFLAMLAHELRNPLAPILNALRLMRMKPTDAQLQWSGEVIERQLRYLTRLVDDLLDVSRITRGKITLTREPVALGGLVSRAVETIEPVIEERGHELTINVTHGDVKINGDPVRLVQAIGNVLGNAAKYTDRGGRIEVSVGRVEDSGEVRIRDNGIGIPADRMPFIFNLFTQLDRGAEHPASGLGIGLALVRQLVEMHGGSVSAHSEGHRQGSEFVIRLPLLGEHEQEIRGRSERLPPRGRSELPRRILVADDNADALESLARVLQLSGHEVFRAAHGRAALEIAAAQQPEVALLDVGMPLLNGYEVARKLRAEPWAKTLLLIAVTGWGQEADRLRSKEAGFDAHLVKPLDLDQLTELLLRQPSAVGCSDTRRDSASA